MSAAMSTPPTELPLATLAALLRKRQQMLTTAESCTGGLIAAACTELAGSSDWFERGFVTYSNEAKIELLGVSQTVLDDHGAVSETVALAMAQGALQRSRAHWAVAVTGIAGPGGGSPAKPVGTVWLAWAWRDAPVLQAAVHREARCCHFNGDRSQVRVQTVAHALDQLIARLVAHKADPAA